MNVSAQLAELAERYWEFECFESPFSAVQAGVETDSAVLFRQSIEDHARRYAKAGEFLAELNALPVAGLSSQERATLRLLHRELEELRTHFEVDAHLRPWLLPVGPDFNTVFFANSVAINNAREAALYVDRLERFPEFLDDIRANLAAGYDKGIRFPRVVLEAAAANTRGIAHAVPEASPWYGPFVRSAAATAAGVKAEGARALGVIRDRIIPAMQAYADFMVGPLMHGARDTISCTDSPDGRRYYRAFVKTFTTSDMGPDEVHALGLAEVARLETEIAQIAEEAGFADDVPGYRKFLSTDRQFIAKTPEALRESLESLCKRVDRLIPAFFSRIPRITYGVDLIPEAMAAAMPPAYAQPSPADGSAPGLFWANSMVEKCPSYIHVPLVVHEAWPGHLMHLALLQELDDLPAFRRHGAVKYTVCVEGWALYCETLALDMGLYQTSHQNYGRLEMEMWRACRLVVDTGIHWHGWTRDRAISYMSERLALDDATIAGEVDRYAALPAQALAYQIGNLQMRKLRKRAESVLGPRFTHRAFHEAVMTAGAVTLPVLEDLIEDWLAREDSVLAA